MLALINSKNKIKNAQVVNKNFRYKIIVKNISFVFIFLFGLNLYAQEKIQFLKIKKFHQATLPDSLRETSGLTFFNEKLYTFNDGGNSSEIFEINKNSGKILSKTKLPVANTDWEAITNDGENFYIGDFGNNAGTRKDLKVFKTIVDSTGKIKEIPFFYPEQYDFSAKLINNNFDAEAMIYLNGKIHVFTKEWVTKSTTHYVIDPSLNENQPARKTETFSTGFFVTDAYYFDKKLYLVGYTKKTEVFLQIFEETDSGLFFSVEPKKYYLGSTFSLGQIEGIAVDDSGLYISGEEFRTPLGTAKQSFYFIPKGKL